MSRISENIRKITKAWGGKTTGNGISDALSDLYNNLPFSVNKPLDYKFMPEGYPKVEKKMVEIVPEQSVTAEHIYDGGWSTNYHSDDTVGFEVGATYDVIVNGKLKKLECKDLDGDIGVEDDEVSIYDAPNNDTGKFVINWDTIALGETITLAIYEEQEVVKPLDPKFVGDYVGGVIWFRLDNNEKVSCNKTYAEVKALFESGMVSNITLTSVPDYCEVLPGNWNGAGDNYINFAFGDGSYYYTYNSDNTITITEGDS